MIRHVEVVLKGGGSNSVRRAEKEFVGHKIWAGSPLAAELQKASIAGTPASTSQVHNSIAVS